MWLFWLKLISMSIAVISGAIAAYREMHPPPKPSRTPTILFILAIVFGVTAIAAQVVGYHLQKEMEQERVADLKYIQTLDLPLLRVGFDLTLAPIATGQDRDLQWMFRFDKDILIAGRELPFYEAIHLHFSPDSGWHFMSERWRAVPLDSSDSHLRFWIYDFGIKRDGIVMWAPKRIVDLTGLLVQTCIAPHGVNMSYSHYDSPVQQVEIYVNSFDPGSRLVVAPLQTRTGGLSWCFYPAGPDPYVEARKKRFYLNPLLLRNSILDAIKRGR